MKIFIKMFHNEYFFSVFSKIIIVILGFMYTVILARYLGTTLKGQLAYINTVTGIGVIILTGGVHQAYPFYKKNSVHDVKNTYIKCCIVMFLVYSLCFITAGYMGHFQTKVVYSLFLLPIMVFTKLVTYMVLVDNPNKKNKWELVCNIVEVFLIGILFLVTEGALIWIIIVIAIKNVLMCIYFLITEKVNLKLCKSDFSVWLGFFKFGFFPMIALLMNNLNYHVDVLMLEGKVTDADIGIYSIAIQIAERIWLVSDAMRDVLLSKLAKGKGIEETNRVIRISITTCFLVAIGIIMVGKPFIKLFFGQDYIGAYTPLSIVLFGTVIMVYYKILQVDNVINKKQYINFIFLLVSVSINLILNFILIPKYGINGAAFASLFSYFVCALLFIIYYKQSYKVHILEIIFINKEDFSSLKKVINIKK